MILIALGLGSGEATRMWALRLSSAKLRLGESLTLSWSLVPEYCNAAGSWDTFRSAPDAELTTPPPTPLQPEDEGKSKPVYEEIDLGESSAFDLGKGDELEENFNLWSQMRAWTDGGDFDLQEVCRKALYVQNTLCPMEKFELVAFVKGKLFTYHLADVANNGGPITVAMPPPGKPFKHNQMGWLIATCRRKSGGLDPKRRTQLRVIFVDPRKEGLSDGAGTKLTLDTDLTSQASPPATDDLSTALPGEDTPADLGSFFGPLDEDAGLGSKENGTKEQENGEKGPPTLLAVQVFSDNNGNGTRQPDEEPLVGPAACGGVEREGVVVGVRKVKEGENETESEEEQKSITCTRAGPAALFRLTKEGRYRVEVKVADQSMAAVTFENTLEEESEFFYLLLPVKPSDEDANGNGSGGGGTGAGGQQNSGQQGSGNGGTPTASPSPSPPAATPTPTLPGQGGPQQ
jgi:hypothetical protein